jgi:hypothetical protein
VAAVSLVLILALVAGAMWSLSDRLAKEEAARSESERLRLVAEEKEQEAIRNAEEAAELAELANQRLEEITAAELRATEKEKETAAERKKREEVEAAAAAEKKEFEDNLERLNQEIARSAAKVGRALRARLVEMISIPILIDGRVSAKTTLPAGETLEVLREDEQRVFVKTRFGDQWIAKSKTEIEREAVQAPAPAPVAAPAKPKEPLTADLSQGKESTKVRHARAGILYQATGFNGATVCFLVTELNDQKLAYQWRAPSDETPEGIAGTGVVDLKNGGTVLEAGPVKLGVNASKNPVLLGYDSTKGVLNRVELGALAQTPWAEPLVGLVKSVEAKPPVAAAEPDRWPIVLLDELFHIGDDTMPGFSSPKPQGREFQTTFSVQQPPLAGVNLTVWVSDIVPNSHPLFKEGSYRTQVRINGTEAGILNEQIGGVLDSTDIEKVVIPIKGSLLRQGPNEFTITGGSAPDGNTDDFNLRKVTLELANADPNSESPSAPASPGNAPDTAPPASEKSEQQGLEITLRGTNVPVTRMGTGPVGVVFFGTSASAQMTKDLLAAQDSFNALLPDKCSLFLWAYPQSPPFDQVQPSIAAYLQGDTKKLRPDFSGIASEVLAQLREKTGLEKWLLVGNSLGAGVLLWDHEKLAADPATSFLLISPTETFMPPPGKLPAPQRTILLAAKSKNSSEIGEDPFLRGPEVRKWTAAHLDSELVEKLPGFERGHKLIGGEITHDLLSRLIQIQLGLADHSILGKK